MMDAGPATVQAESVWLANFFGANTKGAYRVAVRSFFDTIGISSADELYGVRQAHVIAWRDAMMVRGMANRTICNRLSALSSLFKYLCSERLADINPVTGVRRPKVDQKMVSAPKMTREQVRAILAAPDRRTLAGARDAALLHLFAYAGCRLSEPTTVRVRDLYQDGGYWILKRRIKGGADHAVALHPKAVDAIQDYLQRAGRGDDRYAFLFQRTRRFRPYRVERSDQSSELVKFEGVPLNRKSVRAVILKHASAVGVPANIVPHSFRATFITDALANNCALEDVQQTAGHASIQTTRMYDKRALTPERSASFAVNY